MAFIRPKVNGCYLQSRAMVNGRKAVAYVKNGKVQAYEYLDDWGSPVLRWTLPQV